MTDEENNCSYDVGEEEIQEMKAPSYAIIEAVRNLTK